MRYTVTIKHWSENNGFTHNETFDHIDEKPGYTASNYVKDYDSNNDLSALLTNDDGVVIVLEDENGTKTEQPIFEF